MTNRRGRDENRSSPRLLPRPLVGDGWSGGDLGGLLLGAGEEPAVQPALRDVDGLGLGLESARDALQQRRDLVDGATGLVVPGPQGGRDREAGVLLGLQAELAHERHHHGLGQLGGGVVALVGHAGVHAERLHEALLAGRSGPLVRRPATVHDALARTSVRGCGVDRHGVSPRVSLQRLTCFGKPFCGSSAEDRPHMGEILFS